MPRQRRVFCHSGSDFARRRRYRGRDRDPVHPGDRRRRRGGVRVAALSARGESQTGPQSDPPGDGRQFPDGSDDLERVARNRGCARGRRARGRRRGADPGHPRWRHRTGHGACPGLQEGGAGGHLEGHPGDRPPGRARTLPPPAPRSWAAATCSRPRPARSRRRHAGGGRGAARRARGGGRAGRHQALGGIRTTQQAAQYLYLVDQFLGSGWTSPATLRSVPRRCLTTC